MYDIVNTSNQVLLSGSLWPNLQELEQVERELDGGVNLEENAQRIGEIAAELNSSDALDILKGLSSLMIWYMDLRHALVAVGE